MGCWENVVQSPLVSFQRAVNSSILICFLPSTGRSHWDIMTIAVRQVGSLPRIPWPGLGDLQCLSPTFHGTPSFLHPILVPKLGCQGSVLTVPLSLGPRQPHRPIPSCTSNLSDPSRQEESRGPAQDGLRKASSAVLSHEPRSRYKRPATHFLVLCCRSPGQVLQGLSRKLNCGCPTGLLGSLSSLCTMSPPMSFCPPHMKATPASPLIILDQAACFCDLYPPLSWSPQRLFP